MTQVYMTFRMQNTVDSFSRSPLWRVCCEGHCEVVKVLLQESITDVNETDFKDETPLMVPCDLGYPEVVQILLKHLSFDQCQSQGCGWKDIV